MGEPLTFGDGTKHGTDRAFRYFGCRCVLCMTEGKMKRARAVSEAQHVLRVLGHEWRHPEWATCPQCAPALHPDAVR